MPVADTLASSTLGSSLASATQTGTVVLAGDDAGARAVDACVVIVATTVTSGATFRVEKRNEAGNWVPINKFSITANGSYAVPVWGGNQSRNGDGPATGIRVNCISYTDGSYACSVSKLTKG